MMYDDMSKKKAKGQRICIVLGILYQFKTQEVSLLLVWEDLTS